MIRFLSIILLALLCLAPAFAAPSAALAARGDYTATLLAFNHTKPAQNPNYALGREIFSRRLVDKNQRTLGKVEDIILTNDGRLAAIVTTVEVSGFRETIAFDVASYVIAPTRDTYMVNMDKAQVAAMMPKLMAAMRPADGQAALLTMNSLRAGEIRNENDTLVATVSDVMAEDKTQKVVALLVEIADGTKRGATIAIPYEATKLRREGNKAILTVDDDQAETMVLLARRRR